MGSKLVLKRGGGASRTGRGRWTVLASSVNLGFWAIAVIHEWIVRGPFIVLGGDWARFWGAARAFESLGPASGYRVTDIAVSMQPLARYAREGIGIQPGPAPYPPIFLALFSLFTTPPPVVGFMLWTALNVLLAVFVARRLAVRFRFSASRSTTLVMITFFPLMLTLFTGQVVILLLACLMRAVDDLEAGHEFRAGVWTGLLVLKPQYAAVIILIYLVKRRVAAIAGLTLGTLAIAAGSLAVGGIAGLTAYAQMLVTAYPSYAGNAGIDPRGMIGWRGFVATALPFLGASSALMLVAALSLATLAVLPFTWRGAWDPSSPRFARQLTVTIAVTLLVAYHSQPHGAALLLVPGALVVAQPETPRRVSVLLIGTAVSGPVVGLVSALALGNLWLVGPAVSVALVAMLAVLTHMERDASRAGEQLDPKTAWVQSGRRSLGPALARQRRFNVGDV